MGYFRDFNITNNKTYQYIMYPSDINNNDSAITSIQTFANYDGKIWEDNQFKTGS